MTDEEKRIAEGCRDYALKKTALLREVVKARLRGDHMKGINDE